MAKKHTPPEDLEETAAAASLDAKAAKAAAKAAKAADTASERAILSKHASTMTKTWVDVIIGFIGTGATIFFGLSVKGLGGTWKYVNGLINERGPIQWFELICFWMAISIVIQKFIIVRKQRKMIISDPAQTRGVDPTSDDDINACLKRMEETRLQEKSLLFGRIYRAYSLWVASHDLGRVSTFAGGETSRENTNSDATYTIVRTLLWAIPIFGFIGTVQGLAAAVSGFADFLSGSAELSAIKGAIADVTIGLGVAFDTTFLALMLVTIVQFPLTFVTLREMDLLGDVDNYTDEHFLSLLPSSEQQPVVIENLEDSIEAAFRRYIPDPDKYATVFDGAMARAGDALKASFVGIAGDLSRVQKETNADLARALAEAHERADALAGKYAHANDEILSTLQGALASASSAAKSIGDETQAIAALGSKIQEMLAAEKALDRALATVSSGHDFQTLVGDIKTHLASTDEFCRRLSKPRVITFREESFAD